jgi:hypothetical protein
VNIGDRVIKDPETWIPSDFDIRGAGDGVGVVVGFGVDDWVDVLWPTGRCFHVKAELLGGPGGPVTESRVRTELT